MPEWFPDVVRLVDMVACCGVLLLVGGVWGGSVPDGLYLMFIGWLWGGGGVGEGMGTSNFFVCEELFFREGVFRVKFAMESDTLVVLGQRSQTESEDLGVLVRRLFEAAEPLSGQVNGPARAAFDKFKVSVDEISASLNSALAGIVGSISGQNRAFVTAAEDGASVHASAEGAADFSAEGFLSRIGPQ